MEAIKIDGGAETSIQGNAVQEPPAMRLVAGQYLQSLTNAEAAERATKAASDREATARAELESISTRLCEMVNVSAPQRVFIFDSHVVLIQHNGGKPRVSVLKEQV
jgi:CRISPR/Cas system-associated protein Cas10 (large subunit of type III CRISPR-Cas system)